MEPEVPVPLALALSLAVVASLWLWVTIAIRWFKGQTVVVFEARPSVPWRAIDLYLVLIVYLVVQVGSAMAVAKIYSSRPVVAPVAEELPAAKKSIPPEILAPALVANAASNIFIVGVTIAFFRWRVGATAVDLGFQCTRPAYDIALGIAGFVAALLPVYAIQAILTQFFPSEHPVATLLTENPNPMVLLLCVISAVVVAPVAEEFLFRVVLQGWLEALAANRQVADRDVDVGCTECTEPEPNADPSDIDSGVLRTPYVESESIASSRAIVHHLRGATPIVVSSLAFALVHLGHGPDPIPLFVLALILGYLYQRTHRIWPSVVLHMILNANSLTILWFSMRAKAE